MQPSRRVATGRRDRDRDRTSADLAARRCRAWLPRDESPGRSFAPAPEDLRDRERKHIRPGRFSLQSPRAPAIWAFRRWYVFERSTSLRPDRRGSARGLAGDRPGAAKSSWRFVRNSLRGRASSVRYRETGPARDALNEYGMAMLLLSHWRWIPWFGRSLPLPF